MSGIRLRDEWAGDEWRGGSGDQESLQSKRVSGGRFDRGRVISVAEMCETRPGLGR